MKGDDLAALPDDPTDLSDMLTALAGPGAGPNGAELFIDGFSGGQLPAKASIKEIRMNQNPFAAEYDRIGQGRIEIITKPGTEKLHGNMNFYDSESVFNSRNPYSMNKADYSRRDLWGGIGGSFWKKFSYSLDFEYEYINNNSLINAVTLDPKTLSPMSVQQSVVTPIRNYYLGPRIDYQFNTSTSLTLRAERFHQKTENNCVGQYNLPSRAYASGVEYDALRATLTSVLNANVVNETRAAVQRSQNTQQGDNAPSIFVVGSFNTGGSQVGDSVNTSRRLELIDIVSIAHKAHTIRAGARFRYVGILDQSPQNFGGSFTFFGLDNAPPLDANNQLLPGAGIQITSLEQYRRTVLFESLGYSPASIRLLGGGASQFSLSAGNPLSKVGQFDGALFAQDDWRITPGLTITPGIRYEIQSNIGDRFDLAPRLGLAWAPRAKTGQPQKTVIRAGFGVFYDRVNANLTLQQERFDGQHQQQFLVMNPNFYPNVPSSDALAGQAQAVNTYRLQSGIRSPFLAQEIVSIERQLPLKNTLSVSYTRQHSSHLLRLMNINAPQNGIRPYGDIAGNLFTYGSNGVMNSDQLMATWNARFGPKVSFVTSLSNMWAKSDTDMMSSAANPSNFRQDYGRASFERRAQIVVQGTIQAPFGFRFNPLFLSTSGQPYDLTLGTDRNGDTFANERPAFATDLSRPSVVINRFGAFDTNPIAGQTIVPRNYLTGTPMVNLNLRVTRSIGLGKFISKPDAKPGDKAERRYHLDFNVAANNVLNHVNQGGWVGNLASPQFGQSTSLYLFRETANNRRISFGTTFNF